LCGHCGRRRRARSLTSSKDFPSPGPVLTPIWCIPISRDLPLSLSAMSKLKTVFQCQACGFESSKWLGRCPDCGEWNSFVEERQEVASATRQAALGIEMGGKPRPYDLIDVSEAERMPSGIDEFDRVLGGGIVPGSMVLIGGEPGIGKSTLLLQVA